MKNRETVQAKDRLDDLFSRVNEFSEDLELQSHWARYLCVRVSGFIETSIRSILSEYAREKSAPSVANYVESWLGSFQSPNMERILQLLGAFNSTWQDELKSLTESEPKDAIDGIKANRDLIAHGENVGITYTTIQRYYQNALMVVELIEDQCNS
ncbi:MAG: HEPN domain-containing protein [Gemmatimonadetes bacterium]|nr:HEPN domain-containing protein [Gemmatimonadota bacterium]